MRECTDVEIAWLAGLLEGEGYFQAGIPSRPKRVMIVVKMCDEDVVSKVASIFETKVREGKAENDRCNVPYTTQCSHNKAADVMRAIRPFMGARRKAKIDECLELNKGVKRSKRSYGR